MGLTISPGEYFQDGMCALAGQIQKIKDQQKRPGLFNRGPLHRMVAKYYRRPLPELGAAMRLHPVADRNNYIEVIVRSFIGFSVTCSYPEIPDNRILRKIL